LILADRKLFGTDGIRGRVGTEPISPETVLRLGWAAGCVLGRGPGSKILIGKDTRVSGYLLESALEAGVSASGVNISLLGPMPTPGIAYLTRTSRAAAGIVISASHNPYHDNGIKFFSHEGLKLPDEVERQIEEKMGEPIVVVDSFHLGKASRFTDAAGRFIEFCKSTVPGSLSLSGLKIVVDCANGAAYHIAPSVFEELGADVVATAVEPDGFNINENCGSTDLEQLIRAVIVNKADLGIALDGDGDRLIMVDGQGEAVDGDQILYILAMHRKGEDSLHGGVVGTQMSNLGLQHALETKDIPFLRAKVGDRHVMSVLKDKGWILGGESSGHIICLDKCTTGDGIVAALQVLKAMVDQQQPLHRVKQGMQIYPQTLINVRLSGSNIMKSGDLDKCGALNNAVQKAQTELGRAGRVLLRPSGTEPVIRVMVEGRDAHQVSRIGEDLAAEVKSAAI
jgi:phosphoglucosamine mutase